MTERELELIKKARREYKKKWRQQNPDKVKAANDRYGKLHRTKEQSRGNCKLSNKGIKRAGQAHRQAINPIYYYIHPARWVEQKSR